MRRSTHPTEHRKRKTENIRLPQPLWCRATSLMVAVMLVIATTPARASIPTYDPVFYYYHGDHLGSTSLMTDRGGNLVQHYGYTAFGKECYRDNGLAFSVSHRFTDQILDEETGLYYYGGRYYDPEIGRFIQPDIFVPDPLDSQSHNRFAYVRNNPLNRIDPTGFLDEDDERDTWDSDNAAGEGPHFTYSQDPIPPDVMANIFNEAYTPQGGPTYYPSSGASGENGPPVGSAESGGTSGNPDRSGAGPHASVGGGSSQGSNAIDFVKGLGEGFVTGAVGGIVATGLVASGAVTAPVLATVGIALSVAAVGYWMYEGRPVSARGAGQVIGGLAGGGIAAAASKAAFGALAVRTPVYEIGDVLPNGRIAGLGPGAALNNQAAREAAKALGYKAIKGGVPFKSHGQPVFKNGNRFITPDVDQHKGGIWKMFDQKGRRLGTYDENLVRIGD